MDYEKMKGILSPVLSSLADDRNPEDKMINYYIGKFRNCFVEKIHNMSGQQSSREYWLRLAPFVEKWAMKKRGVVINAREMEDNEIDLLITVVCYFEKEGKPQTPQNAERMRKPVYLVLADFRIPRQQPDFVHSIRYPDGTYIEYEEGHQPIVAGTAPPGWEPANEDEAQEIDIESDRWRKYEEGLC